MTKTFIRIRGLVALAIMIVAGFQIGTGVGLWLFSRGSLSSPGLWSFLNRSHPTGGFVMLLVVVVHIFLNRKLLTGDVKTLLNRAGRK